MSSNKSLFEQPLILPPKPILKWAGGKSQLLNVLLPKIPQKYGKYIEPFLGGGALFFAHAPHNAIIADSNPELTNLYRCIASNVEEVIRELSLFRNEKELFYTVRTQDWTLLTPIQAAARTIFLNRTGFNGLYRVNKQGKFNVPFANYKNPNFCNSSNLREVSLLLQKTLIVTGDYKDVLREHAETGDFIFLDPPYLPVSAYSDFKRYTKEQFYEEDQRDLAEEVLRLSEMGCNVVLTNSNHPLVHELYGQYRIEVHQTKRNINSNSNGRTGEDIVVSIRPKHKRKLALSVVPKRLSEQTLKYPPTRYMGSKTKLLPQIRDVIREFNCETTLDLFSGSGIVSYMLKSEGKQVFSNDYMALGTTYAKALIENNSITLPLNLAEELLLPTEKTDNFVASTFQGLYYSDRENLLIDLLRANIKRLDCQFQQAIATAALTRACIKKRPRGIFTYVGYRYDDGRKDLKIDLEEHFLSAVALINNAVFDNGKKNIARRGDAMTYNLKPDLVYMDPPYYSPHSDNEYVRRYHFIEGIACDWQGVDMQWHTKTKKFKSYPTPFSTRTGTHDAFDKLFSRFKESILVISYSSNSLPTLDEMVALVSRHKTHVEVLSIDHRYSAGNQNHKVDNNRNKVSEYLFVGY